MPMSAPKGREIIAHGASRGTGSRRAGQAPEGRKGAVSPLRGSHVNDRCF